MIQGGLTTPQSRHLILQEQLPSAIECTNIAHRPALAIFTADEGIARNSAARTIFTHFLSQKKLRFASDFFAEEIAHLGPRKIARVFGER